MSETLAVDKVSKTSKFVFVLSILVSAVWFVGQKVNVYQYAIGGTVYEMLWLPMVGLLLLLPAFSIFFLFKEKFNLKSLYLYSFLIIALTVSLTFI